MVPIGKPHPGLRAALLDDALQPVPTGEAGELCVSGAQTSPGYWHDPARTAERFVEISLPGAPAAVYYRTGDRARQLPDGNFVCLGRTDQQIKVLGFRVELGEIESAILKVPGVVQAVAAGWPVVDGTAQGIVAFVSGMTIDNTELKAKCKAALPDYMVPSRFIQVQDMPLNSNGKIDRGELIKSLPPTA